MRAIHAGCFLETAAAFGGIDRATLFRWLRRGEREEGTIYAEFCDAVKKAQATAEIRDVATIDQAAAAGAWQAAAWRLERKFPERWGRAKLAHRVA